MLHSHCYILKYLRVLWFCVININIPCNEQWNPLTFHLHVLLTAVVVFAFVLCWLPFHLGRYLFSKSSEADSPLITQMSEYCNLVSLVLFYFSAAINPILYNIMSKKYRIMACRLFGVRCTQERSKSLNSENCPVWNESSGTTWQRRSGFCSEGWKVPVEARGIIHKSFWAFKLFKVV